MCKIGGGILSLRKTKVFHLDLLGEKGLFLLFFLHLQVSKKEVRG
jgi:hypothetical protein